MGTTTASLGTPFRTVWLASTASNLGDGVVLSAVPLLAATATASPAGVALVTVAATAPWLLFGLPAGVVVDRVDRRRLMVVVDVARAAALAAVAVPAATGDVHLPLLAAAVFVLGVGETLFDTAAQALLPRLVPAGDLERANGRLFSAQLVANGFVGPPLGSLLFVAGAAVPLGVDAATFALSAALLARLRAAAPPVPAPPSRPSVGAELRAGLRWVWGEPAVRALAVGAGVVNLAHTAVMAVLVLHVRGDLRAGPLAFGAVLAAAAVGGVAGAQLSGRAVRRLGRRRALLGAVGAFSAGLGLVAAAPHAAVVAAGLAVFGAGGEVWNVVAVSYRQARVPDHLLGRVMATYRFLAYGAMPVGAAAGGALAEVAGVRAPFVAASVAAAVLGVHVARATARDPAFTG